MSDGNEILLPTFDDDESVHNFGIPSLPNPSFGASTSSTSLDTYANPSSDYAYRNNSSEALPRPSVSSTPSRPTLQKNSASYSTGYPPDDRRLGKFSNGSSSSLVTPGTSIGSAPGFLSNRKGSLASIKNAFKSNGPNPVPPVPNLNSAYPTLRNPFSRFDPPASPTYTTFSSPRQHNALRKQSTASGKSVRSAGSQSSLTYRTSEDHVPALPPVPSRAVGRRHGSDASIHRHLRGTGSISALEDVDEESAPRTAATEAFKAIWNDFRSAADIKIARICGRPLNTQPSLPAYLETGIDPAFDELAKSLGHCGKRHARRVVELLNAWCKHHCEGIGASEVRAHLDRSMGMQMRVEDAAAILAGRKSNAAKYILYQAMLQLITLTPRDALGEELGMTLEQNIFNAYRTEKLEESMQMPHRRAVSQLQVELLGKLSSTRFLTISDRFTRELARLSALNQTKDSDLRIDHLLRGAQRLRLRVYPEVELENSAEFLQQMANLYANAHGPLKASYTETLTHLLHSVVETATAEVNHPLWSKAVSSILSKAQALLAKPRYWSNAFPLVVMSLCVSPREIFMQHWQTCIDNVTLKLRDRSTRVIAVNALMRLLWVYLNRCSESSTSIRKRLDTILRMCFTTAGGLFGELPTEPFVYILRCVMVKQPDYCQEFVAEFMKDEALSHTERTESLARAIGLCLEDLVEDRAAPWPPSSDFNNIATEEGEVSGELLDSTASPDATALMDQAAPALTDLLFSCDRTAGFLLLSNDAVVIASHVSSSTVEGPEQITRKHGDVYATFPAKYEPVLRLFVRLLDLLPRCLSPTVNFAQIANVLSRCSFSADPRVADAASAAIIRCSKDPRQCLTLVNTYMQFVFETRHIFRDTFIGVRLLESQFHRVVRLWSNLLEVLVGHRRQVEDDSDLLDSEVIIRIEGCALFLLCSTSATLRGAAKQILIAARDLEPKQRLPSAAFRYSRINPGKDARTRAIQLLDTPIATESKTIRALPWCTSSDRHRIDGVTAEKGWTFAHIAESDNPKDAQLWLALLPYCVGKLSASLSATSQVLRSVVVTVVLRLQGHIAQVASSARLQGVRGSNGRNTADMTALADHWRSYLTILSITMPLQTTTPPTPPIQRTRDAIILTPDTIGTPALFVYLSSLFGWEDPRFKDAAVYAAGAIGQASLRQVTETLLGVVRRLADGSKSSVNRRSTSNGVLWTAVAHVFRLIAPLLLEPKSSDHVNNLSSTITFVKITHALLSERAVKEDYDLQSLRRSFCIVVEHLTDALGKFDSSDRFLGEEMRGAIFKLCYEWCHVGRRPDVAKARESHTLQAAAEGYRGERDRAQYLEDLQAKTKLLSAAAAEAMAGLCQGKLISSAETTPASQISDHIVEPLTVLRWIRGMFSSSNAAHHDTARKALFALIKYNGSCARLLDEVLHQSFGEGEQFSLDSSFFGVVADILGEGHVQLPIEQVTCLALSKLGHPVPDIRQRAFQLCLSLVAPEDREPRIFERLFPSIGSLAPNIYREAQKELSTYLATVHLDHAHGFLTECVERLSQLEAPRRQATLSILPSWVRLLDLAPDAEDLTPEESASEQTALCNLMYLTVRFGDDHLEEMRQIFVSFVDPPDSGNSHALTKFLFEQGSQRKSIDFVAHAQRVMGCLAQSKAVERIFDDICQLVEPSAMAALPSHEPVSSPTTATNLDALLSAHGSRSQVFSTGQLALLYVGEILPLRLGDVELSKRMLTLLHVALLHCDHPGSALREQCQNVLYQVLRSWSSDTSLLRPEQASTTWSTAQNKITALFRSRSTLFWQASDKGDADSAFLAPAKMSIVTMKIIGILLPLQPRLRQQWGEMALMWSTSCPIRHLACRSFQVYRILSPRVGVRMISDTLARLSSTIASSSPEIQSFNLEVIRTFSVITQNLSASEASNHPQLFWCTVACLTTPYEHEFVEVIELLSHILDKFNLADPAVTRQLMSIRPDDWTGPPPHLQSLLFAGLRSSKAVMMTFDLIRRLSSSPIDDLIDAPGDRLIHGFVAALPWMLQSIDLEEPNEELSTMALDLASIADSQDQPSLSRLLSSFARARFRTKDDFVKQACSLLRDFFPTHALEIITQLMGFVINDNDWMREKTMKFLKLLFQASEARDVLQVHGDEIMSPVLRLIGTKHAAQALDLLDMPITTSREPGAKTIFGDISESGWCIPDVKEASRITKENVGAVFKTCTSETRAASQHFSVVQFTDLKPFDNSSQISLDLPSPQASSVDLTQNPSLGDLVGALQSLNQFFDDGLDVPSPSQKGRQTMGHRHDPSFDNASDRRLRAVMTRGMSDQSLSGQSRAWSPSNRLNRRHEHTASDVTTSSVSSADATTRRPLRPIDPANLDSRDYASPTRHHTGHREDRRGHGYSYSYSSTELDEVGDIDNIETNLWGLDDDRANMSNSSIQIGSDASTPVNARRTGLYVKNEEVNPASPSRDIAAGV